MVILNTEGVNRLYIQIDIRYPGCVAVYIFFTTAFSYEIVEDLMEPCYFEDIHTLTKIVLNQYFPTQIYGDIMLCLPPYMACGNDWT